MNSVVPQCGQRVCDSCTKKVYSEGILLHCNLVLAVNHFAAWKEMHFWGRRAVGTVAIRERLDATMKKCHFSKCLLSKKLQSMNVAKSLSKLSTQ